MAIADVGPETRMEFESGFDSVLHQPPRSLPARNLWCMMREFKENDTYRANLLTVS